MCSGPVQGWPRLRTLSSSRVTKFIDMCLTIVFKFFANIVANFVQGFIRDFVSITVNRSSTNQPKNFSPESFCGAKLGEA